MQRVIAFTANPESPNYAGALDLEEVATCLSQACGHWGSGAEYLYETVMALEGAGVHDPYLWALQDRVAGLIEARFPERGGAHRDGAARCLRRAGGRCRNGPSCVRPGAWDAGFPLM